MRLTSNSNLIQTIQEKCQYIETIFSSVIESLKRSDRSWTTHVSFSYLSILIKLCQTDLILNAFQAQYLWRQFCNSPFEQKVISIWNLYGRCTFTIKNCILFYFTSYWKSRWITARWRGIGDTVHQPNHSLESLRRYLGATWIHYKIYASNTLQRYQLFVLIFVGLEKAEIPLYHQKSEPTISNKG